MLSRVYRGKTTLAYNQVFLDVTLSHNHLTQSRRVYRSKTNLTYNQVFLDELITAAHATFDADKHAVGVYTSHHNWVNLFGETYVSPLAAALPLWYAHYDGKNNTTSDFKSFGGWQTPQRKQFAGTAPICGVKMDLDFLPFGA
jgi:hypothetical protein